MKPFTKAIPSTDRKAVAMINAEVIERKKNTCCYLYRVRLEVHGVRHG